MSITVADVAREVRAIAAENPEFVYRSPAGVNGKCLYVHTSEDGKSVPGCLVGQALHKLGVPLDEIAVHESKPASDVLVGLGVIPIDYSDDDRSNVLFVDCAQHYQDDRQAWGEAIRLADSVVAE